jgi:ribosomal protein S18 acetylase RimI-like enzyme
MTDHPSDPDTQDISGAMATLRGFFRNQERWLERLSSGESIPPVPHTRVRHDESVTSVRTGHSGVMCLNLNDPFSTSDLDAFERSWRWLRNYGQKEVLAWSLVDRPPMALALLARGFETSFRPIWMARSLAGTLPDAPLRHVEVRIATPHDIEQLRLTRAIPYLVPEQVEATRRLALVSDPRVVWWLVARDRSGILGQAIVNMTDEIAGLYNVAVHPSARRRGIGRALTTAAMQVARDQGATTMALNATPEGLMLYQNLGFMHLGNGATWFLPSRRAATMPDAQSVAIAEAIGAGRIDDLDPTMIPARLPNGDLPMQFAAQFGQQEMVHWLLERNAEVDVLALWDVGLHEEAAKAMSSSEARERPSGPYRATPLHHAVERDDIPLAELLIAAGADLTARDSQFRNTPLGWAEYLDRPILARMIRKAGGR